MINWLARHTRKVISSVEAIKRTFSTNNTNPDASLEILPNLDRFDDMIDGSILSVDKSLLIRDILKFRTVLITRPRRWGKSLNLQMLQSFFQPKFSLEGDIIEDPIKKENFSKMIIRDKELPMTPITKELGKTKIIDLQGTIPVIPITFDTINDISKDGIKLEFIEAIRNAIIPHRYLKDSPKVENSGHKEIFKMYIVQNKKLMLGDIINDHLLYLVESLNQHHNKKPIILVDEYDRLLVKIKTTHPELYEYASTMFVRVFSFIKKHAPLVQLSVFTGITRIAKEDFFSGLNNFCHDSVFRPYYTEHFGFTELEVDQLIKKVKKITNDIESEDIIKEKMTRLYYGYRIDKTMIYNPWSVMNCLSRLAAKKSMPYDIYWLNSGDPRFLIKTIQQYRKNKEETKNEDGECKIETLIKSGEVEFIPNGGIEFDKLYFCEDSLLKLMLDSGYLTSTDRENVFRIPNNEVRYDYYQHLVSTWLPKEEFRLISQTINQNEFEDPKTLIKVFQEKVLKHSKEKHYPEFYFQVMLYFSAGTNNFSADFEHKTSDSKRIDLLIQPKNSKETIYIIEVKKEGSNDKDYDINKGFNQIFEKYADYIINKKKEFTTIVIRVVYFEMNKDSKDSKDSQWNISIAELKFTRNNLIRAIDYFVQTKELYKKFQDAKGKEKPNYKKLFEDLKEFTTSYFYS